jgi:hypothetical protein
MLLDEIILEMVSYGTQRMFLEVPNKKTLREESCASCRWDLVGDPIRGPCLSSLVVAELAKIERVELWLSPE